MEASEAAAGVVAWLQQQGGSVNKVEVAAGGSGVRGVVATSAVAAGDVLVSVPFRLCFSVASALEGPLKPLLDAQPGLVEQQDEVLAMQLMHAKLHPEDPAHAHACSLPTDLRLPFQRSEEELAMLQGTNVQLLAQMLARQINSDWETVYVPLMAEHPCMEGFNLEDYKWAMSMVYSRAFGLQRGDEYVRCIAPVLDMANHTDGLSIDDVVRLNEEQDTIEWVSNKAIESGAECLISYGSYCNAKLLYNYGFVSATINAEEELPTSTAPKAVDWWTRVPPTAQRVVVKQKLLEGHPLTSQQTYDFEGTLKPDWISPALLATIRVIQAQPEEFQQIEKAFRGQMISVRNELASYTALKSMLQQKLDRFPTTIEQDKDILRNMVREGRPTSDWEFMCTFVRLEDKQVFQGALELLDRYIQECSTQQTEYRPPDHEHYKA